MIHLFYSASDSGGDQICPAGFSKLTTEQQQAMVEDDDSLLHCYCDELTFEEQQHVKINYSINILNK